MGSRSRKAAALALLLPAGLGFAQEQEQQPVVLPPITVWADPLGGFASDSVTPPVVLSGENLDRRKEATIGETVKDVPGVSQTYFGPGASRPVIRGFDGPRVRVLSDGVDSLDAATVSPDHAVTGETALARQVELLRGPATLLYGGGAIGGVVNVLDNRVPTAAPAKGYEVEAELRGNFNSASNRGEVDMLLAVAPQAYGAGTFSATMTLTMTTP